jgi:HK97 family phage portal protein
MGLISDLRRVLTGSTQDRALWQVGDAWPVPSTYASVTAGLTAEGALRLSAVWACVRLLSDTISTLPIDVFRRGEQVDPPSLLVSPAAGLTRDEWLYQLMVSLLLRGNAYGLVTARSGAAMRPAQVEIVNPDTVTVRVEPDGRIEYRRQGRELDPDDVWHVRAYLFPGNPVGLSPIEYARQAIGLGLATQRFGVQFFEDGAHPSGLLSSEQDVAAQEARDAKERFIESTRGTRAPVVLGKGMKFQTISVTPEESQFLDTQKFSVSQVARVFGVQAEMIGGSNEHPLTYINGEAQALDFLRYSLSPWLARLEHALERLLPRGMTVKFNPNALLRATTVERYAAHQIALGAGFMTIDEVRALEDLPALGIAAPRLLETAGRAAVEAPAEITVNVPAQEAPVVNVNVPSPRPVTRYVERDEAGRITRVTEEPHMDADVA